MKRAIAILMSLALMPVFSSCNTPPTIKDTSGMTVDQVGTVRTSVISVAPWRSYMDALQPQFNLKLKEALAQSVATTRRSSLQQLNNTNLVLGVGQQPGSKTTSTTTSSSEAKTTTTTSGQEDETPKVETSDEATTTGTTKEESVSEVPAATIPGYTDSKLTPNEVAGEIAIDPRLHYHAATALYQEIQILDRHIKDAVERNDYTPYLVRLQFTLMPRQHDLPLDAYINLSFFLNEPEKVQTKSAKQDIVIVPLISTSNYESSLSSAVIQQIQDLKLAIQSLGGIGNFANIGNLSDKIDSALARDINNTFIIGRLNDNTIRVKIGALQQLSSRYSMVPRTEYATVMMLVPEETTPKKTESMRIQVNSYSEIVNTLTGQPLRYKLSSTEDRDIETILEDYFEVETFNVLPQDKGIIKNSNDYKAAKYYIDYLWRLMRINDYKSFAYAVDSVACNSPTDINSCKAETVTGTDISKDVQSILHSDYICRFRVMNQKNKNKHTYCLDKKYIWTKELWVELAYLQPGYISDYQIFELPTKPEPKIFPKQATYLLDNGKTSSMVTLYSGKHLRQSEVCAALCTDTTTNCKDIIPAGAIRVQDDGSTATLVFPSMKKLGYTKAMLKNAEVRTGFSNEGKHTCWSETIVAKKTIATNNTNSSYMQVTKYQLTEKDEEPPPKLGYQVKAAAPYVMTDEKGTGQLRLQIKGDEKATDAKLIFFIDGALVKQPDKQTATAQGMTVVGNLVEVDVSKKKAPFYLDFTLNGLVADEDITISVQNEKKARADDIKVRTRAMEKKTTKSPG